jgi:peptide/nickel transport system substrate-binding protein
VPEIATAYPRVSRDGRTYTFTLRSGFRFSDGTPVRASAFARAINRTLAPALNSPGAQYTNDVVGAEDVQAGKRTAASGVVASGNRLVVRLKRHVADFPARMTIPFFCAVPPRLPADPEGVGAFPAAGPYYVAEYRPGQRVVIRRNRFYRGRRPHHVDRFLVDVEAGTAQEVLDRVERGQSDFAGIYTPELFDPNHHLAARYGINKSRFFVVPGLALRGFTFNTSRPLFRNNASLRRAVNFAIDRPSYPRAAFGNLLAARLTDQYLPPTMAGFDDAHIYPLRSPNVRKAKALARGHTRSGKAVLYTFSLPSPLALGQILKQNLARIGLDVEIKGFSPPALIARLSAPREPYDIAWAPWSADYVDPYAYLNLLFDGRFIGSTSVTNTARFNSPRYNARLRRAARLQGAARYRAYGKLDVELARVAAPMAAIFYANEGTLVSKRVGCVVVRPGFGLDLTAACLKR